MRRPRNWNANTEVDVVLADLIERTRDPLGRVRELEAIEELDFENAAGWLEELHRAEANLRHLRHQFEAWVGERRCHYCDEPLGGRPDRRYCSTRCRVAAHRAVHGRRDRKG